MNYRNLIKILLQHKNNPELGGDFDVEKSWHRVVDACGFDTLSTERYSWRDYLEYGIWYITHAFARSAVSVAVVALFVFGGWVGMVNASIDTLPGDRLYPLKISVEKIRLATAFSSESRSKLQVDFASKRLEEMVELTMRKSSTQTIAAVHLAAERFKTEVTTLTDELTEQATQHPEQTKQLAKTVNRKTEVYESSMNASSQNTSVEIQKDVEEVQEVIKETQEQVVEVILTVHELAEDEETKAELDSAFEKGLALIDVETLSVEQLEQLELAKTLKAEGSYRRAFQVLKEMEADFPLPKGE